MIPSWWVSMTPKESASAGLPVSRPTTSPKAEKPTAPSWTIGLDRARMILLIFLSLRSSRKTQNGRVCVIVPRNVLLQIQIPLFVVVLAKSTTDPDHRACCWGRRKGICGTATGPSPGEYSRARASTARSCVFVATELRVWCAAEAERLTTLCPCVLSFAFR